MYYMAKNCNAKHTVTREPEQLYTIPETAAFLKIRPRTAWKYVHERSLGSVLIGRNRRVPASAIQEFIDRGFVQAVQ